MDGIDRIAFFTDKNGNEINTIYNYYPGKHLRINTYCGDNPCGYLYIYFHPNKRLYLDVIYCYSKFRHTGIGTYMMKLAEYVLRDYSGYLIRGAYEPGFLAVNDSTGVLSSKDELVRNVVNFYCNNDFQIINYIEYVSNPDKYPDVTESDFILSEYIESVIVAKKLKEQDFSFFEERKVIFHNSYSELILKRNNIK